MLSKVGNCTCDEYWYNPLDHNARCPVSVAVMNMMPKCEHCGGDGLFDRLFNVDCAACKGTGRKMPRLEPASTTKAEG